MPGAEGSSATCALTLDDLAEKARLSEIESLDQVKWAVLETNGDISFIKQPAGDQA